MYSGFKEFVKHELNKHPDSLNCTKVFVHIKYGVVADVRCTDANAEIYVYDDDAQTEEPKDKVSVFTWPNTQC